MNTSKLNELIELTSHYDKDERYMATNDLCNEFNKGTKIDEMMEAKICSAVVKQLDDSSNDVQTIAVKCLSVLIKKVQSPRVIEICEKLSSLLLKGEDSLRDVYSIGLKRLITDTPEEMGPVIVGILPRQLLEGLNRNLSEGVKRECLDILTDLLKRFGALCSKQHNDILTTVLKQLQDKKPAIQKRASTCLVAFSVVCSDPLFDTLVETILSRVDSSKEDVPSLIQTIGIISRTVGYRMGRYLNRLVPMFIRFCGSFSVEDYDEDEDQKLNELRENSLPGLESFVIFCPREISNFLEELLTLGLNFMCYDPNYQYADENEEEEEDMELEEEDDDEGGMYDGDDDKSWKVRKAAVKLVSAIVNSRSDCITNLYSHCADSLIARFKDREENVRIDVLNCFSHLVICTSVTNGLNNTQDPTQFVFDKTVQRKPGLQRTSSISCELRSKIPQIFKAIQPLLVSNSVKTKSAVFNLLNKLIEALQGGLDECLDSLIDLSLQNLKDKNQTLKLEALQLLRAVMENHDINILASVPSKIIKDVLLSINENWYKIIAEGLRVLSTIIGVIRPIEKVKSLDSNERYSEYAKQMFDSILSRVEALDIDQEIKVCAIGASGKLVAFLGDHMDPASVVTILTILRKRLENEITRISSLRSIIHIAGSPLKIDLSSILEPVISDLTSFLRQQSRLLKQTSLAAVGAILQSSTVKELITGEILDPLFKELSLLMIDSDLNLAQHALKVTIIIFEHYPSLISSTVLMDCMVNHIFPKSIQLAYSPLLLGSCQLTLISFLQTIITLKIPNLGFKECFTALTSQSIDNIPRHSILNLAKCIAGICLKCDESDRNSTLQRFSKDIEEGKFSSKHLALLCVGELGQQYDMSNAVNLKELILNCFANELEDIKMAAAYALGHLAAGNQDIYLPSVLMSVDTSSTPHPYQYFLLASLKELIFLYANMSKQFQSHLQNILSGLLNICNTQEDSVRNMVAECLGALLIMHSDQMIPTLIDMTSADDNYTRRTIATSLRHFFSRKLQKSESEVLVVITKERMEKFICLLSDTDLEVRKASLLMINAALRHHGYVLNENLKENVIPRLFEALEFKLERTVDLGPFKHTVDDGLPLRKSALLGIESILDGFPGKLDLILFMPKLIACLVDKDELKMQAFQIIAKIRNFAPSVLVGCLDQFIEPFGKVISKKVAKEGQVGPEVERAIELQRNAVKTITIINNIEDASINRRWQDFVESIRQKEGISAMFTEIELEKNNDQF